MGLIPEIPELRDVLTGDLKGHGRWLVVLLQIAERRRAARMSRRNPTLRCQRGCE
jgi:hypothetical protein